MNSHRWSQLLVNAFWFSTSCIDFHRFRIDLHRIWLTLVDCHEFWLMIVDPHELLSILILCYASFITEIPAFPESARSFNSLIPHFWIPVLHKFSIWHSVSNHLKMKESPGWHCSACCNIQHVHSDSLQPQWVMDTTDWLSPRLWASSLHVASADDAKRK